MFEENISYIGLGKVSGFWSLVGFKIGAVTRLFFRGDNFFPTAKYVKHCIRGDHIIIPYIKYGG